MSYEIKLDVFEGPLDLLLYLIRKSEIDIYNIPVALITDQYLQYLEIMRTLNLDLAGEYLLLASTLIHIKSQMLLPKLEMNETEDEEDPRDELVQQLLEYKTYKEAALFLDNRLILERDVFKRSHALPDIERGNDDEIAGDETELTVFDLINAFQRIVAQMDKEDSLEIRGEAISLAVRINEIMEKLLAARSLIFQELIEGMPDRRRIIYTLLAILELMKLRMIKVYQAGPFDLIRIFPAVEEEFVPDHL